MEWGWDGRKVWAEQGYWKCHSVDMLLSPRVLAKEFPPLLLAGDE